MKIMRLYYDAPSHGGADVVVTVVVMAAKMLQKARAFGRRRIPIEKLTNPYRPELHYMRGPGPACRAKQLRDQ